MSSITVCKTSPGEFEPPYNTLGGGRCPVEMTNLLLGNHPESVSLDDLFFLRFVCKDLYFHSVPLFNSRITDLLKACNGLEIHRTFSLVRKTAARRLTKEGTETSEPILFRSWKSVGQLLKKLINGRLVCARSVRKFIGQMLSEDGCQQTEACALAIGDFVGSLGTPTPKRLARMLESWDYDLSLSDTDNGFLGKVLFSTGFDKGLLIDAIFACEMPTFAGKYDILSSVLGQPPDNLSDIEWNGLFARIWEDAEETLGPETMLPEAASFMSTLDGSALLRAIKTFPACWQVRGIVAGVAHCHRAGLGGAVARCGERFPAPPNESPEYRQFAGGFCLAIASRVASGRNVLLPAHQAQDVVM